MRLLSPSRSLGFEVCQSGEPAAHLVTDFHVDLGIQRQENINARAKFDKPEFLSLYHMVTFLYIPHDTPGQSAGYLAKENLFSLSGLDRDARPFVQRGRLWMPGHQIFSGMVAKIFYYATYWISVNVDVDRRHKNRDLQPLFLEVFGFLGFLDNHHLAVGRTKHHIVVLQNIPRRVPEKLQNGDKQDERKEVNDPGDK